MKLKAERSSLGAYGDVATGAVIDTSNHNMSDTDARALIERGLFTEVQADAQSSEAAVFNGAGVPGTSLPVTDTAALDHDGLTTTGHPQADAQSSEAAPSVEPGVASADVGSVAGSQAHRRGARDRS